MAGFSTYYAQRCINNDFVGGATKYLALFLADPTDDNVTANEVTGAWYARQPVSSWTAPVGTGASTANSNQMAFNPVTGAAVTVTHWAIYDAVSGGNEWASGAFTSSKVLDIDDIFTIKAGEAILSFD